MPLKDFNDNKKEMSDRNREIVTLTLTHKCNLHCLYCYESVMHKNSRDLDLATIKSVITKHMDPRNGFEEVEFGFFGGEPMLRFDLIQESIEWFKTLKWEKPFIFFISTNGTILDNSMKSWLSANRNIVVCGLSLDGCREAHNIGRDGSYDMVMANLDFIMTTWPGQPIKMTITKQTIPYVAESIIDLETKSLAFTANVVYEDIWSDTETKKKYLKIYEGQLEILVDYYINHPQLFPVGPLLAYPLEYMGKEDPNHRKGTCSRFCGAGKEMIMIDVDGSEYPCHRYAPWVAKRGSPPKEFKDQVMIKPEVCCMCRLVSFCPTCAGFNWEINGDPEIRTMFHCDTFKLEVIASAKIQAHRLAQMNEIGMLSGSKENITRTKMKLDSLLSLISIGI